MSSSWLFASLTQILREGWADTLTGYTTLPVDPIDPPDLTDTLQRGRRRIVGHGSFGTVYHCSGPPRGDTGEVSIFTLTSSKFYLCSYVQVAVKVISFPPGFDATERDVFIRVS